MPKPKSTSNSDIPPGFKVRIIIHGAIIHSLAASEPVIESSDGKITHASLDIIPGTDHGDSIGFIRWEDVSAITWRKTQTSV